MTYTRKMYESPPVGEPAGIEWTTIYYEYDQPLIDRVHYVLYRAWWLVAWKVKPISWVIDHVGDRVHLWWHRRSCDGECTTRYSVHDGSSSKICDRMPISAQMDCKLYLLDNKNNTNVKRL